jgi:hypothetical protein
MELEAMQEAAGGQIARARCLVMLGGLLAGLIAFAVGEQIHEVIPAEKVKQNLMGSIVMVPDRATQMVADTRNGALVFGVLGVCLGGCLGVAGGLARRSSRAAVAAGLLGAVLGLALGAGLSLSLLPWFLKARFADTEHDLVISLAMHCVIWGMAGAAGGLAFAVGLGDRRLPGRTLIAGLAGGALGAAAFELLGAAFFTAARTGEAISESWPTRLMARLLVTVGTAAVVALFLAERQEEAVARQKQATVAPPEPT